jgi:competence protein ComEA
VTSQERLALGTALLLLAGGAGVRALRTPQPLPAWPTDAAADAATAGLGERAEAELAKERRAATPLAGGETIDVNRADETELRRLPGVGPKLAERIAEHRRTRGAFRTLADLDAVPGIGPAMLERIAPHVGLPAGPPTQPGGAQSTGAAAALGAGAIDLNRATAAELTTLPGIGPKLAERIIRSREEQGRFDSVAALRRVPGIGERTLERLAPYLRAGP